MSRWCDRSIQSARHSAESGGIRNRIAVWNSRAETILASGHVRPHRKAGHMIASDPINRCSACCKPGAVHIWIPASAGMSGDFFTGSWAGMSGDIFVGS